MSNPTHPETVKRIIQLFFEQGVSASVIKRRLGVSERTIWNYVRRYRDVLKETGVEPRRDMVWEA